MAFAPRSVHQPQHCIQSSSRRFISVVFSGKYIQSVEIYWLPLVGAWKTCVPLWLHCAKTPDHLDSVAGSGKSVLWFVLFSYSPQAAFVRPTPLLYFSSAIIQDIIPLRDAGRASLAYFYFDFRDVDKQRLHNLLPSLLIQLSAWSDPCCDILSRLYSAYGRGAQKPSDRTMVECLKEMLTLEGPTYIIMDGLDECPITSTIPSPREEVVGLVEELVGLRFPNLHICITSRPEHDIQLALEHLTEHPVSLHDESGQQEDIANHVASFVRSDQRIRRWREEDKNLVIKTLSEKADGM